MVGNSSDTFQNLDFDGSLQPSLSVDATIVVSTNYPIIGEHVVIIIVTLS